MEINTFADSSILAGRNDRDSVMPDDYFVGRLCVVDTIATSYDGNCANKPHSTEASLMLLLVTQGAEFARYQHRYLCAVCATGGGIRDRVFCLESTSRCKPALL